MTHIHSMVLCGGSGTRLWPLSRNGFPKQFLALGDKNRSLLQETIERLTPLSPPERRWLILAPSHEILAREQLGKLVGHTIVEPEARNTAAAVVLAAWELRKVDPEGIMVVVSADQVIEPMAAFAETMRRAVALAEENCFVVAGIRPTYPATGFGYIEVGGPLGATGESREPLGFAVSRFKEKPDQATAESFLRQGNFLWNAGMFIWKVSTFWAALREIRPDFTKPFEESFEENGHGSKSLAEIYAGLPREPIDVAFIEKATNVACVPALFDWNDVGSWGAVGECYPGDAANNVTSGDVALFESRDCVIHSEGPLVAGVGLENLVVVATSDAVLVIPKERSQDVKLVVEHLKKAGRSGLL